MITLVGRSPRLYAPGMLDALNQRTSLLASAPPGRAHSSKAKASVTPHYPHQRDKGFVSRSEVRTFSKYPRNETGRRLSGEAVWPNEATLASSG